MSLVQLEQLPDDARVWVFGADRSPGPTETSRLLGSMEDFLAAWTAHRADLRSALDWRHHRFLVVAVDEAVTAASGCSIDTLMRRVRGLEEELDLRLVDGAPVWYRDGNDRIRCVDREAFRRLSAEGVVDRETPVFDVTVDRLGLLRAEGLERPAGETWHARLLEGSGAGAGAGGR